MTPHQLLALACILAVLAIAVVLARGEFIIMRDQLAMARHVIAELAPKAQAWDAYLADRRMPRRRKYDPPLELGDTRVQYQHLSAECDGCDDEPAGAPDVRFQVQHYPV